MYCLVKGKVQGNASKMYSSRSRFLLDWECSDGKQIRKKSNTQNETESKVRSHIALKCY